VIDDLREFSGNLGRVVRGTVVDEDDLVFRIIELHQ